MSLTTKITTRINATQESTNDFGTPNFPMAFNEVVTLANGTSSSQADLIFSDQRTLTASSTEDLDLAGGLTDAFGNSLTFVKIKAILIKAASGNTNNVEVTPAAANGFTGPFADASDQLDIPPGGLVLLTAPVSGWTVTASTGDLLTITNSGAGTSVTYDVIIVGTSA